MIDLTGKGVNLIDRSAASPFYNFTGGDFTQNTSWIGAGTGFLAIEAGNGSIQLLGSATQSGFAALQALDANGDGVINASDPGFASLVVWQDLNGDGVAGPGEVESLAQLGVVSISLTETGIRQAIGDSTIVGTATATMADGTTRTVAEADLDVSSVYTKYVGSYTPNPLVAGLPDLRGYGTLPDLAISISQDSQLLSLVQQLTATDPSNTAAFDAATRAVLFRWAGVDAMDPASGNAFDGQELGFLQQLLGNTVGFGVGSQRPLPWFIGQSNLLQASWDAAFSGLKARLLVQLPGSPFAAAFQVDPASDLVVPTGPLSLLTIAEQAPQGTEQAAIGYWINALDVINASVADLSQISSFGTTLLAGLQAIIPSYFSPAIVSAVATGTLSFVQGTALAGRLAGTTGSDLFVVEQHNAVLTGLGGGDEFVVGTGLGSTEINETDNAANPDNTLLLNGILPSQVVVSGDASGDIVLTLSTGDTIKLDNMLAPPNAGYLQAEGHATISLGASTSYGVQNVVFSDGTVWTSQQIIQMEMSASTNPGTTLYGTAGSDVLDGQGLKTVLQGNGGSDTFVFDTGYGHLEINQHQSTASDDSILRFGPGITASQVAVTSDSSGDLILTVGSNGDRVTVDNMLGTLGAGVQAIDFADGTAWSASQVLALASTGTAGNDELYGTSGPDVFDGKGGIDYEQGNGGGDTFVFDAGYGTLEINEQDSSPRDYNVLTLGAGITEPEVTVTTDGAGDVVLIIGSNGDRVQIDNMLDGPRYGIQAVEFADGTVLSAASLVAGLPVGSAPATAAYATSTAFYEGQGQVSVNAAQGDILAGTGITASNLLLQSDAGGDLILRLRDTGDSLTVRNDLSGQAGGIVSQVTAIRFSDGSSMALPGAGSPQALNFTWVGTASSTALVGSNYGTNTFDFGPGGDTVVAGNTQDSGPGGNTFLFDKGDGQAVVNLNGGTGSVELGADIVPADVLLHADNSGDLTIDVLDTGDSLTLENDLTSSDFYGRTNVSSAVTGIQFGDGSTLSLTQDLGFSPQPLLFTWIGDGTQTTLTGSNLGSNLFILGPGNVDVVGGSGANTYVFDKGDGHATVLSGGTSTVQFGAGITASGTLLQTDAAGDLTISFQGDSKDSLTIDGDLTGYNYYGRANVSSVVSLKFTDSSTLDLSQDVGFNPQPLGFTTTGTASNTILTGSSLGSNTFVLGAGGDTVTGGAAENNGINTYVFGKGDGQATVIAGGTGVVQLGAGVAAFDVTLQANSAGDLTIALKDDAADSLTIKGDLTASTYYGRPNVASTISAINFGDGTSLSLANDTGFNPQPLAFTWTGTASNTTLTGSNFGSNAFTFGLGGDTVTGGDGENNGSNTYIFDRGDGQATVLTGGTGVVQLEPDIAASDMVLQADNAGNLTIALKDDPADSLTIKGDLTASTFYGRPNVASTISAVDFGDGTSLSLANDVGFNPQPLAFTWTGTASKTTLTGSNFGSNDFTFGPGGDTITGGDGENNGSNTYVFDRGDGEATVLSGGIGTVQLGSDIAASDVVLQADNAGNLTIALKDDPADSLTIKGDLTASTFYGRPNVASTISAINFGDGTSLSLASNTGFSPQPLTFTWTGTASNTILTGSNLGSNTFILGPGGDTVTGGIGSNGTNTYDFDKGDGNVTILSGGGVVQFGNEVTASNLVLHTDSSGDLAISLQGDPGDTLTIDNDLTAYNFYGNPDVSSAVSLQFADGSSLNLNQDTGFNPKPLVFTSTGTASNTILTGSNLGSNTFILGPGGDRVQGGTASNGSNTYVFDKSDGQATVTISASGVVQLGADIAASDVILQADPAGDLTVALRDDPSDSITFTGDLSSHWWGVSSQISSIDFADGTTLAVGQPNYGQGQGIAFAWVGTAADTVLTGSGYGTNSFDLGAGGDTVTFGNGSQGGSSQNTVSFDKGDGEAMVNVNGSPGTLTLGADITASDVILQADAAGDLTVALRGDPNDSITFTGDLSSRWWGVSSQLSQISFADGTTLAVGEPNYGQGQGINFTWVGTATDTTLTGSGYGANSFDLGAGCDTVTFGNGGQGGLSQNTISFDKGDGQATVEVDGGSGTLNLGSTIAASDVILQADAAGDLTVALKDDPSDSITFVGDLSQQWWGTKSQLSQISFADGTTLAVGEPNYGQGQGLTFTWVGTAADTTLTGSGYGANSFNLGVGGDTVTFGNGSQGGSAQNTVSFDKGDGDAKVNVSGGSGTLNLGSGIAASDVILQANSNGDLTVALRDDPSDSITFVGDLSSRWWGASSQVSQINFADGTTLAVGEPNYGQGQGIDFTWVGTGANTTLTGSSYGANSFNLGAGGDTVTFGNGSQGGSNQNTVSFNKGDGEVMVNVNGSPGTLTLGADITASDVILQADAVGDLTVGLRSDASDSITFLGDLSQQWWGVKSQLSQISFADGTTLAVGEPNYGQGQAINFTWPGTAPGATLAASNYGANLFDFQSGLAGSDVINGFNPSRDTVQFRAAQVSSFAALQADASSAPGGTLISLGQSNSLLLQGVTSSQLQSSAFKFV